MILGAWRGFQIGLAPATTHTGVVWARALLSQITLAMSHWLASIGCSEALEGQLGLPPGFLEPKSRS